MHNAATYLNCNGRYCLRRAFFFTSCEADAMSFISQLFHGNDTRSARMLPSVLELRPPPNSLPTCSKLIAS